MFESLKRTSRRVVGTNVSLHTKDASHARAEARAFPAAARHRFTAVGIERNATPAIIQRTVVPVPNSNPAQFRSTLISDRVFTSEQEAAQAEQAHVAAIEQQRQRQIQEAQAAQARLQQQQGQARNPMFAPPRSYFVPTTGAEPQGNIFSHLQQVQTGAANRQQMLAHQQGVQTRALHRDQLEDLEGVDPQLHQFADPYGDLSEI